MDVAKSFYTFFFKIQSELKLVWDNPDKAKDNLIARDPVFYQKTLFRAFLHNELTHDKKVEFLVEKKKLKAEEVNEYLNIKSENGFEFIKKERYLFYSIYYFRKETIDKEDNMTYQQYTDYQIMLKQVLRLIHAPYLNQGE